MSEPVGMWIDLTVDDADSLKDFYSAVTGWSPEATDMGDYADYTLTTTEGHGMAGVCWRRGVNADLPTGWIPYFPVADIESSVKSAVEKGATLLKDKSRVAYLKDPSGAVFALFGL
jgi:predicted enzyme related to lactoylglutathione lyase